MKNIMGKKRVCCRLVCILDLYLCLAATCFFIHCDARKAARDVFRASTHSRNSYTRPQNPPGSAEVKMNALMTILLDMVSHLNDSPPSNGRPFGVSSPFYLPTYDSLAPIPLPESAPPVCVNLPFTQPSPRSTIVPIPPASFSPSSPYPNPPPSPFGTVIPSPPESIPIPTPPACVLPTPSPPESVPSPPSYVPSPPSSRNSIPTPSSGGFVPCPPSTSKSSSNSIPTPSVFLPPIVYPPPAEPPPPYTAPTSALWCVAKPSVPGPIIQEAMNYACGSGAECGDIQPGGSCFEPNTLIAHASYAFNSYWQRTKVAGGTCEFGGTAMLVTEDPSKFHMPSPGGNWKK